MKVLWPGLFLFCSQIASAQSWVDTVFHIGTSTNIDYGVAPSFEGSPESLAMDVSYPIDDTPPACGRPLMVIVHGGAWYGGDKNAGYPKRLREDFAKRGYVTASVSYRLGMFNTEQDRDCVLEGWKCFNMTDSAEWYRANYRAIQDVHGAIRFLTNASSLFGINPDNVFVVGESAGGFVALGVGFLDDSLEVLETLVQSLPDVPAPNAIYEAACIQAFGLADNISAMDLSRPSLGAYLGPLNLPSTVPYRIRGVGNIYGGAFNNIFQTHEANSPALYLFHQPCDLLVPFNRGRILAGYNSCAMGFPTFCQDIINRPLIYGSKGITALIDTMEQNGIPTCEYYFDQTANNYGCVEQVLDPNLVCHAIDNFGLRTTNMASYFASHIAPCSTTGIEKPEDSDSPLAIVYPNPTTGLVTIRFNGFSPQANIYIMDVLGRVSFRSVEPIGETTMLDLSALSPGVYYAEMIIGEQMLTMPIQKD